MPANVLLLGTARFCRRSTTPTTRAVVVTTIAFLGALGLAPSCAQEVTRPQPTPANLVSESELASIVVDSTAREVDSLRTYALQLASAETVLRLGAGGRGGLFGRVSHALLHRALGEILVWDSGRGAVWRFSTLGVPLGSVQVPGRDMATFLSPLSLARLDEKSFALFHRQGVTLAAITDDRIETRSIRLNPPLNSGCAASRTLFVHGWTDTGKLVRAIDASSGSRHAFGATYASDDARIAADLSTGAIGCSQSASVVLAMMDILPYVVGYSLDGVRRWISKLGDYRPVQTEVFERGKRLGVLRQVDGYFDRPAALLPLDDTAALLQVSRMTENGRMLRSYLFDLRTGRGQFVGDSLPLVLDALWPDLVVVSRGERPIVSVVRVVRSVG